MTITFAGHADVYSKNRIKEIVKERLRENIVGLSTVSCYIGGYGDFDLICAQACMEIKKEQTFVEVVYVTPYISPSEQVKIKYMQECNMCDTSIYPPIENVPPRFAILKRNEWMINNSDMIIAYVNHNYGGAYKSLQVAKRAKKKIINICDFI